ncbi:MAG: carbamoyltransferase HypF [Campylobacterota bacterium]|nr:carbamoyltransferase HypF [Campylobacterota bacterium]
MYKLASFLQLNGFVKNSSKGVEIELQGTLKSILEFEKKLYSQLPVLATIDKIKSKNLELNLDEKTFKIIQSDNNPKINKTALISPDIATCQDCLDDIKLGRFKGYFATNCTNCGPRYSIIKSLPYDRKNSSMAKFELCLKCKEDYENPQNRRYHAQPISCNSCGAKLSDTIKKTVNLIKNSKIIAIKGIGGFHIVCDATDDAVIKKLRKFKNRLTKPFAIMCKDLEQVKEIASLNQKEIELLTSKERPIVILDKISSGNISEFIAPKIDRLGCLLPYTPLHHLVFDYLDMPIVATSANLASQPIITTKEMIKEKLPFVDFILDFNRDIVNAIDDSVVQVIAKDVQTLRQARGYTPKVIKLPFKIDKKILAVGANQKNSISLAFEDNIILSPYIGDLDSLKSFEFFERTVETFKKFYDFEPDLILHDKHPNYETTKWAKKQGVKCIEVPHHLAHIYACKAEFGLSGDYVGFSFDGTGFGDDGNLWGGEVFVGDVRKYHFKPTKLLGGEIAIKEPKRIALSMLFDNYSLDEVLELNLALIKEFTDAQIKLLYQSYLKNINAPLSSSVGRLFDGVASLANILQIQSYEGEAGLTCEMAYDADIKESFSYEIIDGVIDIKFDFFHKNIVSKFINSIVEIIINISKKENKEVILSGGVFQNKTLLELVIDRCKKENIKHHYQKQTPINDGSISLGQIYYKTSTKLRK